MVAVTARMDGWRVTYLGPSLPAEDIAAVLPHDTRAVALSVIYPPDDPHVRQECLKLRHTLPPTVNILVGGHAADAYSDVLDAIGARRFQNFHHMRVFLESLRSPPCC